MIKTSVALIGVSAIINGASAVGVAIDNAESSGSTLHENSAYQLELANGTTNVFNITKYIENAETGELTPQVYNVVFTNQLGNADATGDQVKYFSWEKDTENGGYKLVAGNSGSYDLKVGLGEDVYAGLSSESGGAKRATRHETIDQLNGVFVGNSAEYNGGAIYTVAKIANLTGDFVGNSAGKNSRGGAIYNYGNIGALSGNFIGNVASEGGAIFNGSNITTLSGEFIGNVGENGGAIYNDLTIESVTGNFSDNYAKSNGGAIFNNHKITSINGDFVNNEAGSGGAISNNGTISTINGDFIGNVAQYGGAIDNSNGTIGSITGDFIRNSATYSSGAICNRNGTIGTITGDFIGNSVTVLVYGGAIYNYRSTIGTINGNFIGNTSRIGGAIANDGLIATLTGDFIGNVGTTYAGAIHNSGNIGLFAMDRSMEFTGNTAGSGSSLRSEAIYLDSSYYSTKINMNSYGANKIVVNDGIRGQGKTIGQRVININNGLSGDDSKIDAEGKSFGVVEFNNNVQGVTVNVSGGTLKAGSYKGGVIDLRSGKSITTQNSIAKFIETDVKVANSAKLLIGADVNGNASVSFDADSSLTLENGATLAFEENSSLDFDGTLSAENSTLFFELSDYVAGLEGDETFDLDWTFATFENADAAADALAGFGNFGNDLGILKGDKDSEGLWFDVVQNGHELKVVGVIPEPATIGLLGLVGGALLAVRRRFSK